MKKLFWKTPETQFSLTCLVLGCLGFLFLGSLVAEPKVLFGRSLTAITPTLFPSIVLTLMFVLCAIQLVLSFRASRQEQGATGLEGWRRGGVFFGVMTVYALAMVPIGFITSSALTIGVLSVFIGNRNVVQIVLVAVLGPVLLFLAATRLLAVSLPELNVIELAISRMF
jgi:putative tricarboxylic transport membrane protein